MYDFCFEQEDKLRRIYFLLLALAVCLTRIALAQTGLQSSDLYKLRSVGDVQFSPDGSHIAYTIENNGLTGRPYSQLWIMSLGSGKSLRLGSDADRGGTPEWSPD